MIVSGFRAALDLNIRPRCAERAKPGRGKPVLIIYAYWLRWLVYIRGARLGLVVARHSLLRHNDVISDPSSSRHAAGYEQSRSRNQPVFSFPSPGPLPLPRAHAQSGKKRAGSRDRSGTSRLGYEMAMTALPIQPLPVCVTLLKSRLRHGCSTECCTVCCSVCHFAHARPTMPSISLLDEL